jgi:septum formation topological specificity factor MinE
VPLLVRLAELAAVEAPVIKVLFGVVVAAAREVRPETVELVVPVLERIREELLALVHRYIAD